MELNRDKGEEFVRETQTQESAAAWKKQLDEFAPGASDWVVEAVFGGTYQREGITLRDRQMLNMAALAAMGGVEPQLTGHIKTAVDVAGMSPSRRSASCTSCPTSACRRPWPRCCRMKAALEDRTCHSHSTRGIRAPK